MKFSYHCLSVESSIMASWKFAVILVILNVSRFVKCDQLDDLYWEPGDLIKCKLSGVAGWFATHYMIGGEEPRHLITVLNDGDKGRIVDLHQSDFTIGINRNNCWNSGKSSSSREEILSRAKPWIGQRFTYNVLRCNCQHWTNYWTNGSSGKWYHNQSLRTTASYCPI